MNRSWVADLITENPMLIEVRRFTRKFLGLGTNSTVATAVMVLAGIAYAALLLVIANWSGDIDPISLVWVEGFVMLVGIPIGMHGSIAGEREKRTWDLLLVAPLTKAQIVAGKFISSLGAILGVMVLFTVPIGISAVSYAYTHYYNTFLAQMVVLSFAVLMSAMTLFFSARAKRGMMALGLSLGTMFVLLVVIPALVVPLLGFGESTEWALFLHPWTVLERISNAANANRSYGYQPDEGWMWPSAYFGWPHVIVYLVFAVLFLVWAERTLTYAEGDKRFLKKATSA